MLHWQVISETPNPPPQVQVPLCKDNPWFMPTTPSTSGPVCSYPSPTAYSSFQACIIFGVVLDSPLWLIIHI